MIRFLAHFLLEVLAQTLATLLIRLLDWLHVIPLT